jgi:hypothetical protein
MNRNEFERIAEAVLDGTASASDREQLMAHVAVDPQAGEIWSDLQVAHAALAHAEMEQLPAGLRAEILRGVRSLESSRTSWWSEVLGSFRARPELAFGATFAAGLAIGVLAFGTMRGGWEAGRELAPSTVATLPAQPEAAAPIAIEVGGAGVEVSVGRIAGGSSVTVVGRTGAADVTLEWDPQHGALTALGGGAGEVVSTEPGRAVIRLTPDAKWTLNLRASVAGGDDLRVTVQAGGSEERRTVHLPG